MLVPEYLCVLCVLMNICAHGYRGQPWVCVRWHHLVFSGEDSLALSLPVSVNSVLRFCTCPFLWFLGLELSSSYLCASTTEWAVFIAFSKHFKNAYRHTEVERLCRWLLSLLSCLRIAKMFWDNSLKYPRYTWFRYGQAWLVETTWVHFPFPSPTKPQTEPGKYKPRQLAPFIISTCQLRTPRGFWNLTF